MAEKPVENGETVQLTIDAETTISQGCSIGAPSAFACLVGRGGGFFRAPPPDPRA